MSHFTVLVVGEDVEGQLAPFHEFECTGADDQYIVEVDKTEEARESYEKDTETRVKSPSGKLQSKFTKKGEYKKRFLREPTPEETKEIGPIAGSGGSRKLRWTSHDWKDGKGYRTMIVVMPEGWSECEVPSSEILPFAEWIEGYYGHKIVPYGKKPDLAGKHKYGYTLVTKVGEVIKTVSRTNPEAQWDWYQIGGRWNGFFKMKPEAANAGVQGTPSWGSEPTEPGHADQARKGEIDIEGMRSVAGDKAGAKHDLFHDILAKNPGYVSFDAILDAALAEAGLPKEEPDDESELTADLREKVVDAARKEYRAQPTEKALMAVEDFRCMWEGYGDLLTQTREQYVQAARDRAFTTFAVLENGNWHEKGKMGWFACVSNEKEQSEWNGQFNALIDSLSDDALLTVVDCHI